MENRGTKTRWNDLISMRSPNIKCNKNQGIYIFSESLKLRIIITDSNFQN